MERAKHIFRLGVKELISLSQDAVLIFLILYSFTFAIYTHAKSAVMDVVNASIAIVNEDDSEASRTIRDAMLPPLFLPAVEIPFSEINHAMDTAKYTFVVDVPPKFQQDLAKNTKPTLQTIVDATAMSQAGRGPGYIRKIVNSAVGPFWGASGRPENQPVMKVNTRGRFNPNYQQSWFVAINQVINNI